jgi:hypothetical protein
VKFTPRFWTVAALTAFALSASLPTSLSAQTFDASSRAAQVMLGTGGRLGSTLATPSLSILLERGTANDFLKPGWTLGTSLALYSSGYKNTDGYTQYLSGSARFNVHFPIWDRWDTYAGLGLGVALSPSWNAGLVANIGARYALSDPFYLAFEGGYGNSWLNVGLGARL